MCCPQIGVEGRHGNWKISYAFVFSYFHRDTAEKSICRRPRTRICVAIFSNKIFLAAIGSLGWKAFEIITNCEKITRYNCYRNSIPNSHTSKYLIYLLECILNNHTIASSVNNTII